VIALSPNVDLKRDANILLIGAHSDDIEIGCGGTILRMVRELERVNIRWVVFSSEESRFEEARKSAGEFLAGIPSANVRVDVLDQRNAYFPDCFREIKDYFEQLKSEISPDMIFTHQKEDLHQDHRVLADLTWNTFRSHLILEYEIPKYDGGLRDPNLFMPLAKDVCERKIEILFKHFESQRSKHWFTRDLFLGLMRVRGLEGGIPGGFAEAFYCRKSIWSWSSQTARPTPEA